MIIALRGFNLLLTLNMNAITIEYLESIIVGEVYFNTAQTTICVLTLKSGFEVVGSTGVVDKSKFVKELGEKFAREDAVNKLWPLEGYLLQNKL